MPSQYGRDRVTAETTAQNGKKVPERTLNFWHNAASALSLNATLMAPLIQTASLARGSQIFAITFKAFNIISSLL